MLQLTREQVRKWVKENYPNVPTLLSSIYGTAEDIERSGVSQLRELDRKRLEQIKERAIEAVIVFYEGQLRLMDEEIPEYIPEEYKEWFRNFREP